MMRNISLVMGRGIEGCGVTKFTIEQAKYYANNDDDYKIWASKDKTWSRKNAHTDIENLEHIKFTEEEVSRMISEINATNVCIVNSLPPKSMKEEAVNQFARILKEVKVPIVLIQLDHNIQSLRRNCLMDEFIERADMLFALSPTGAFGQYVNKIKPGKVVYPYEIGFDFDAISHVRVPLSEQDVNHHKWIGRTVSWKGFKPMFEFAESSLTPGGKLITFEGIDRSPAFLGFKNDHEFQNHLKDDIENFEFEYGKLPYVFGAYVHSEMLHRLARSGFAYQLSILKPASINMALEYTHCEIVAAGAIPVFRKAYGDHCKHRWSDKPLTECQDTGTVWLDEYDHKPAYKLIEELSKDDAMREDYRKMSLDFYRDHQDSQHVYESLMDKIENNI
jgi:hypothetical protein